MIRSAKRNAKSFQSWSAPETTAASSMSHGIGPQKFLSSLTSGCVFLDDTSLKPN